MNVTLEHYWTLALRLKLRESSGVAFQDFVSTVFEKLHGSDFVRVRPFGQLGDKGCDGYVQSSGLVVQCYGAVNGSSDKVATLISKMEEDYNKCVNNLSLIMKEWHFAHNLVDGLPVEAIQKLDYLQNLDPTKTLGFIGVEAIEYRISQLDEGVITELLGPIATNVDVVEMQVSDLRDLINSILASPMMTSNNTSKVEPVSVDKLDVNNLPGYWKSLLIIGWQNAVHVSSYLSNHPDPLLGERVGSMFNTQYRYLKAQNLDSSVVMDRLYQSITGYGTVSPSRQVAAQALLAHLFESCDILENYAPTGAA